MLSYVLFGIFMLSCLVLVVSVLLQPGKADAGALFTSSVSSTAFGPRGTQTILAKITIVAAIVFMLSALLISFNIGGTRSVVAGEPEGPAAPQQQQSAPAPSPQTEASPAATAQQQQGDAGATNTNAPAGNANATNANANGTSGANAATTPGAAANPQASPRE